MIALLWIVAGVTLLVVWPAFRIVAAILWLPIPLGMEIFGNCSSADCDTSGRGMMWAIAMPAIVYLVYRFLRSRYPAAF